MFAKKLQINHSGMKEEGENKAAVVIRHRSELGHIWGGSSDR